MSVLVRYIRRVLRMRLFAWLPRFITRFARCLDPGIIYEWKEDAAYYGATMPLGNAEEEVKKKLDMIPSETTLRERLLLYTFFSRIWTGDKDVLEIGPFLGGTTRAIAMGMEANPCCKPEARLLTYDRFRCYHGTQQLLALVGNRVSSSVHDAIRENRSFLPAFEALHRDTDYGHRIEARTGALPVSAGATSSTEDLFRLDSSGPISAVFVDGCKGWYQTKYFMLETAPHADVGTWYIFQDYGWFTCFWIPVFIWLMRDYFSLLCYVDSTYVFTTRRKFGREDINSCFSDTAEEVPENLINELFGELWNSAKDRHDRRGMIASKLQQVAALAYIGKTEAARKILHDTEQSAWAAGFGDMIELCRSCPTFTPDGQKVNLY